MMLVPLYIVGWLGFVGIFGLLFIVARELFYDTRNYAKFGEYTEAVKCGIWFVIVCAVAFATLWYIVATFAMGFEALLLK